MTTKEFKNLKIGDSVKLGFSLYPNQIVIGIDHDKKLITSRPSDDEYVRYVNHIEDVEYVEPAPVLSDKDAKEKEEIKSMFNKFAKNGCANCPFKIECDNTYNYVRRSSTSSITICNALHMDTERDW